MPSRYGALRPEDDYERVQRIARRWQATYDETLDDMRRIAQDTRKMREDIKVYVASGRRRRGKNVVEHAERVLSLLHEETGRLLYQLGRGSVSSGTCRRLLHDCVEWCTVASSQLNDVKCRWQDAGDDTRKRRAATRGSTERQNAKRRRCVKDAEFETKRSGVSSEVERVCRGNVEIALSTPHEQEHVQAIVDWLVRPLLAYMRHTKT